MPDSISALTEIKISELPEAAQANATDLLEASQSEGTQFTSRKLALDLVTTLIASSPQLQAAIDAAVAAIPPPPPTDWTSIPGKPATFPPDPEAVDDRVAGLLVAGTNIGITYNDPANTLTINATAAPVSIPVGSVAYGGAGGAVTGVLADFAWDATNKRLGIGVAAPAYKVHVQQSGGDLLTVDGSGIVGTAGAVRALLPFAWQAGGQYWASLTIGTTSGGYLGLFGGTGVPTASTFGAYGSLYVNASSPGIPYYNNSGGTGWDQLVGLTATQTLVNKTFAPASISPGINGQVLTTVSGAAAWAAAGGGPPTGAAGGVLAGTYPNPSFASPMWRQIGRVVPTAGQATVDFTSLPTDINDLMFTFDVTPTTTAQDFVLRFFNSVGAIDATGPYGWSLAVSQNTAASGTAPFVQNNAASGFGSGILFDYAVINRFVGNTSGIKGSGKVFNIRGTRFVGCDYQASYVSNDGTTYVVSTGSGYRGVTGLITGLRFLFNPTSTFAAGGAITLWGSP